MMGWLLWSTISIWSLLWLHRPNKWIIFDIITHNNNNNAEWDMRLVDPYSFMHILLLPGRVAYADPKGVFRSLKIFWNHKILSCFPISTSRQNFTSGAYLNSDFRFKDNNPHPLLQKIRRKRLPSLWDALSMEVFYRTLAGHRNFGFFHTWT